MLDRPGILTSVPASGLKLWYVRCSIGSAIYNITYSSRIDSNNTNRSDQEKSTRVILEWMYDRYYVIITVDLARETEPRSVQIGLIQPRAPSSKLESGCSDSDSHLLMGRPRGLLIVGTWDSNSHIRGWSWNPSYLLTSGHPLASMNSSSHSNTHKRSPQVILRRSRGHKQVLISQSFAFIWSSQSQ